MYIFVNSNSISESKELLLEFENTIFKDAFPDDNERESFVDDIIPRIEETGNNELQTFCVLSIDDEKTILGGLVADWYPECRSLELIYLAVDKNRRQHKIGSTLLANGINLIKDYLGSLGIDIKHIFLEVDIPTLKSNHETDENASSIKEAMSPVERLIVWERWGAKRIPINYVQPPLSKDKGPVSNMMLMYLNGFTETDKEAIPAKDLISFLKSFYKGLNASNDENLKIMIDDINMIVDEGMIYLEPITECPYAVIGDATITTHFQISGSCKVKLPETCNDFNSFECDLMNYMNQIERPFKTKFVKLYKNIPIVMPSFYCYTSEGITHYFRTLPREELTVDISISLACPNHPETNPIANLSIKPSSGLFSDYDYIRITTGFGSRQEGYKSNSAIMFLLEGQYLTFKELIKVTLELDSCSQVIDIHEGVSQLNINKISPYNTEETFPTSKFFDSFKADSVITVDSFNKVVCGLILGIFDHNRMNSAEVEDTIRPIVNCSDSIIVVNRGHIFKIEDISEEDNRSLQRVLISPYILTPSILLAFNGLALKESDAYIQQIQGKSFNFFIGTMVSKCENILDQKYKQNIFQYQSEQSIFKEGCIQRSMDERYNQQYRRLDIYKTRIQKLSDIIVELILGLLAIFGLAEVLSMGTDNRTVTIVMTLAVLFIFYEFFRWYKIQK